MLRALSERLRTLAKDPRDDFAQKVRAHLGEGGDEHAVEALRNLVVLMPALISQIRTWLEVPDMPSEIKRLLGFLLTYLYQPIDFLPERHSGLFGYLDDAYAVATVYHRTLSEIDYRVRQSLPSMEDIPKEVPQWLDLVRKALPRVTIQIDRMFDDLTEGDVLSFENLINRARERRDAGASP